MWIKLHSARSEQIKKLGLDDTIWVQTQNITCIAQAQTLEFRGKTAICFVGSEENYILVEESVDEIGAMIKE